jgi:IgGFc binding protein
MRATSRVLGVAAIAAIWMGAIFVACSAGSSDSEYGSGSGGSGGSSAGDAGPDGTMFGCNTCIGTRWQPCDENGTPLPEVDCEPEVCAPQVGCTPCLPGALTCVGNEVHECTPEGQIGALVEECDVSQGQMCGDGECGTACDIAADQASNVGCEFWAVDLDQQDYCGTVMCNDPASAPWGIVLSNASQYQANVTIELNEAPVGAAIQPKVINQLSVNPGDLQAVVLPTRELDCGIKPNDYMSPGSCLSSQAYRITSSNPIIVYQFNVFENAFSNDASLLLPTSALGRIHRVINWPAGHPIPSTLPGTNVTIIDRSYVTVVGTKPNTQVKVRPSWRIRGNPPNIPAIQPGEEVAFNLGPFDVLNLETDDATFQDDPKTMADLTSTIVEANQPVAVFSGVESTAAPGSVDVPTPPGGEDSCCLDHLEDQMFPVEAVGSKYVIPRSPVRSTGSYREPDVLRFMGVAETATVTTNLPAPNDSFTLEPGQVVTTWTQDDVIVDATKPVMVGQILVSQGYVEGGGIGDPSLTVFPPVDQYRTEYVILTPGSWTKNWVVIAVEVGVDVTLDGATTSNCIKEPSGVLEGTTYETRRCPLDGGVHRLSSATPFGIVAYGYGSAGSYAFVGGADVKRIYDPPPLK